MAVGDENRSFGAVEEKLAEAEFFLCRLKDARPWSSEGRFYFSAFVSAARSVTWAMQASLSHTDGFGQWYTNVQRRLGEDALARFFVDTRNRIQKRGHNPLGQIDVEHLAAHLQRQLQGDRRPILLTPDPLYPSGRVISDAIEVCTRYFTELVRVVWECCVRYREVVDARWYFTEESFARQGKTLEDALEELGFPRDWFSGVCEGDTAGAWRAIRSQQPGCGINDIFLEYIGTTLDGPDDESRTAPPE